MIPLLQRNAHSGDMPYVLATWVRSYAMRQPSARRQNAILIFRKCYVDRVMAADPHIVVLCSPEKRSALHAYAVALDGALAWVYVARDLRGQGYAREAITAVLRGYPETIRVHCAWPYPSDRFKFEKLAA